MEKYNKNNYKKIYYPAIFWAKSGWEFPERMMISVEPGIFIFTRKVPC